jgi:hypothetical protein
MRRDEVGLRCLWERASAAVEVAWALTVARFLREGWIVALPDREFFRPLALNAPFWASAASSESRRGFPPTTSVITAPVTANAKSPARRIIWGVQQHCLDEVIECGGASRKFAASC